MAEYIDKQVVIDEVDEWYSLYPDSDTAREALSLLKKAIKKISPEDVRPVVRGRWMLDLSSFGCYECSICGENRRFGLARFDSFCPNCGADMRGMQDE